MMQDTKRIDVPIVVEEEASENLPTHHRDGKLWDPARYNPDNSDTWKCNGLNADCGYSHAVPILTN